MIDTPTHYTGSLGIPVYALGVCDKFCLTLRALKAVNQFGLDITHGKDYNNDAL